jgi:hypothetical protein
MAESEAHKQYMKRYRERRKRKEERDRKKGEVAAQVEPETDASWRTRRHRTRKTNGELTTSHLFDLRNRAILMSEDKEAIDNVLRARGELAPKDHDYYPCTCLPLKGSS